MLFCEIGPNSVDWLVCNQTYEKMLSFQKYEHLPPHLIINSIHYMYFNRVDYNSRVRNDFYLCQYNTN